MGRASRRKKEKRLNLIGDKGKNFTSKDKLEIEVFEDIPPDFDEMFPGISSNVIDFIYLRISQGIIRGIVRFEVYKSWMNPDYTIETENQLMSAIWRADGVKDDEMIQKWSKENEKYIRNYGTEIWTKLRAKNLTVTI